MVRGTFITHLRALVVASLFIALILPTSRAKEPTGNLRAQVEAAIAAVKPALVRIRVVSSEFEDGREVKGQAVGSGAIITPDGYLVTNHHVAGHATRIFCTLWNREEVEAELVGTDALTDISVLKLKPEKTRNFTYVTFGNSSKLEVGDSVLAMGSPMALSQSVTLGIISNTEMIMPRFFGSGGRFRLDGEDVGALVRWIGHDAAIYGGNSGGPLVNMKGEVVGINEISFGLSGAIPGNLARSIAGQLMAKGKVERSWLGLDPQPLFKHSGNEHGVLIGGVVEGGPADKAGMKAGDLLIRLGEQDTDVRFDEQMPDFMWLVSSLVVGADVKAVVNRDGKEMTLHIKPEARSEFRNPQEEVKQWGITGRNLSAPQAREMKRDSLDGVYVSSVRPGGPSGEAKPAIQPGDTIVEVDGTSVKNLQALDELSKKLSEGKKDPVPVVAVFERRGARYMAVVRVGIQDLKDPGLEVTKAWLPVETHVISREVAKQLGQPSLKGFYITRIFPGTTAEKSGLKLGDFITAVDGEKLTATASEHEDELSALIRQYDVGKTVELSIIRGKSDMKIPVALERSPRLRREMKKYRNDVFEFTVRDVSFFDSAEEQWDREQHGALVEDVKPGSWAELGSLYNGDLIVEVNGKPVGNVDTLRTRMEEVASTKAGIVTIKVLRGIHTAFLEIEPNWKQNL